MSEEIDKLAGATSLKISEMTLESDLMGAEKFPFIREGIKTNFITTLNRIKEYVQKDVCTVIYELKSTDLNTFKGDEAKICVIGVQKSNESATLGNHYPVQESGILIAVGTIADKTNQIYQTYNSNRLFIRCATSNGLDGEFSEWQEIAKISDVLTKNNTTPFSPTNDYNPATKKYVDDSISSARSVGYMMQLTEIDASGLDENTWYPVTIAAGERMNIRVEVLVSLDSGTKPSWSTHERGFSTRKIWEFAPNVWGVNRDSNITIYLSDFVHADIDPVRGLGNMSQFDKCYVYVRGGGKYHFYASHNAYVTLRTDTYKPEGGTQSVSPTIETPAEIVADIATKKYVKTTHYGKTIVVSDISKFLYSIELNGADAEQRIVDLFGSIDNFKNVVADILANHTRYYFYINNNLNNNCIELGCVNAWRANDSTSYELHFVITYFGNNPVKMFTNRISIISNDDNRESKVIIASLVNSDNINTLTKKTSAEYKGIGSKDKETIYAITDA